jgi:surface protein
LTLVALFAISTGAWAEDFLYLVVDGTSATMMYGADKGDNPYYTIVGGYANWYVPSAYDPETYNDKMTLTTVTIDASCKNYTGTTLESLFDWWSQLTTINGLENLNTSAVTDMQRMFTACQALTSLDLSCLNTASVTNMREMFNSLTLETLDLSSFNTSNVTDMYCMFYYCQNLKNIYVGDGWSTASVTNGNLMFSGCPNLPGFDSGKVTHEMAKLVPDGYLAEAPIEVTPVAEPAANTKQWTFSMPGSDVVLTPQYAPVAKWVVEGEGDNAKTLLPTAAENIIAGTTDPIIVEGTVATSTYGEGDGAKTIDQGTVMYAVTETNTTAPALTAYSDDVPTAAIVEGAVSEPTTRYVWYYIQGANTPAEEEATDKNTFNNSEVCATPLTVTLLPNVFNLVLKPTKANDITVEVNEVDKTLELIHNATENEDTLKAVKMQSDVKIKAKTGYKFRKVEVKKKAAEASPEVGQIIGSDGKNYDANATLPDGVTAVAMIAYVGSETGVEGYTHGLALALTDKGQMSWTDATGASGVAAHTPAAPTTTSSWMLPSRVQWEKMITAAGSYTALRDGFSGISGASNLQSDFYWSSTEYDSNNASAWRYAFSYGGWTTNSKDTNYIWVRACLAF